MRFVICTASLMLLAGCAAGPSPTASQESAVPAAASELSSAGDARPAASNSPAKADAAPVRNFQFDKMSVALSESEKVKVLALVDQAISAQSVVIRGHCDRTAVGNAKDAAVARAVAVQRVLRKAGVDSGKIRIRYNTSTPLHMAEVEFE